MSMQEWPDDHLDDLFRKSAEEFDVPYEPTHWVDMHNRLDRHDRQAFYDRLRFWGGMGVLAGLLLLTLWWAWQVTTVAASLSGKTAADKHVNQKSTAPATVSGLNRPTAGRSPATLSTTEGRVLAGPATTKTKPPASGPAEGPATEHNRLPIISVTSSTDVVVIPKSRPTPSAAERRVVTPDWAVRSRETAGQWRRQPTTGGYKHKCAKEQPVTASPAEPSELEIALNTIPSSTDQQPLVTRTKPERHVGQQPAALPVSNRTASAERTPAEAVTTNGHRSTGSPELTSSASKPVTRSGGLSGQSPAGLPITPPSGSDMAGRTNEIVRPERLNLLTVSTAQSLTAVQLPPVPPVIAPDWEAPDRPVQRPFVSVPRLSVMAVVSPDLSAIGLRDFTRPGTNAGLMVQYRLTNRFSFQTGALVTTKKYQTMSENYVWPSSWAKDPWPSNINGTCTMIDIPLNLRYDWLLRPRGDGSPPARWFASTGLTSYFIKHEIYTYDYADPNDPRITYRGWDNQKAGVPGGKFGFSNLNVSVGYERPIGRHLSWQVEPFMKIPLQQVGFFKVRLLSTGAFIGLKYSF